MTTKIPTKEEQIEINITSKDFPVTEGIKTKIYEKLTTLDKFAPGKKDIKVTLTSEPEGQKVEVSIALNKAFLKNAETTEDLYKSVDLVVEKLKTQLTKLAKTKASKQNRASIRVPEISKVETVEEETKGKIVKRKVIAEKPMFEEEAIMQMEALNHLSFMFINAETFKPSMLYKRKDGNYGIIDVE